MRDDHPPNRRWLQDAEEMANRLPGERFAMPSPDPSPPEELYLKPWVGYSQIVGTTLPITEIIRILRTFNRWSLINTLSTLNLLLESDALDERKLQAMLIRELLDETIASQVAIIALGERVSAVFNRLQVLNTIKLALHSCSGEVERPIGTPADLKLLGKALLSMNDHLQHEVIPDDMPRPQKVRLLSEWIIKSSMFSASERFPYVMVRYHYIYTRLMNRVPRSRRVVRIGAAVKDLTGVSLGLLLSIGFALLSKWPRVEEKDLPHLSAEKCQVDINAYLINTRTTKRDFRRVVEWLSSPIATLAEQATKDIDSLDEPYRAAFRNMWVRKKPLVLREGRYLTCLDRQYFMDRLTRGVYWGIFDSLPSQDREDFASLFGDLVHEYTRRLLRRVFGRNYITLSYRKGQEEVADGIIVCGGDVVVVEIKSARVLLRTQQEGDLVTFKRDIDKILVKARNQIARAIEAIRYLKVRVPTILPHTEVNYHPLVITAELFPTFRILHEVIDARMRESGDIEMRRTAPLTIMRLEDLEVLEPIMNEARLVEWLKQRNNDLRLREMPFKVFILERLGRSIPHNVWMQQEFEKVGTMFTRTLFGHASTPLKLST